MTTRSCVAAPSRESFVDAEDRHHATADYFWMIREGILSHSAVGWRSFSDGYMAIGVQLRGGYDVTKPRRKGQCHANNRWS